MLRFALRHLFVLTLVICLPDAASAQKGGKTPAASPAPDTLTAEARARFDEGVRAVARRDYEAGRVAFKQAYALKPVVDLLRNLGAAEVMSHHPLDGARHLTEYLAEAKSVTTAERAELEKLVREAEKKLGRLEIEVDDAGAVLTVDGEAVKLGRPWHVEPGKHVVGAAKPGAGETKQTATVAAGATEKVVLKLAKADTAPVPSEPAPKPKAHPPESGPDRPKPNDADSSMKPRTLVLIGGTALTAVGLGLGIGYTFRANAAQSDIDDLKPRAKTECTSATSSALCRDLASAIDRRDQSRNLAAVGFVGAGTFAAGTLGVLLLWPARDPAAAVLIVPRYTPHEAELSVAGRF